MYLLRCIQICENSCQLAAISLQLISKPNSHIYTNKTTTQTYKNNCQFNPCTCRLSSRLRRIGVFNGPFSSLTAHIVGCGREEYTKCFTDIRHAIKRASEGRFVGNFGYIFHSYYDKRNSSSNIYLLQ